MEKLKNIIVVGASAGGFTSIKQLISNIPGTINAAVLVVLHMSSESNAHNLVFPWQKVTSLVCEVPVNGTKLELGHLYLAPAKSHMMVKDDVIRINFGPHENRYRPSIDILFRSAAVHYGPRAIGIVLSGVLDDGTSGMSAIKRCGGTCIVQEPAESEYSDMPQSVINHVDVDYRVRLNDIGYILSDLLSKPEPEPIPVPHELQVETEITEKMMTNIDQLNGIADRSDFTCPDCGGRLWMIKTDPTHRYRCHTGHVYNEETLCKLQGFNLEESIYVSIRLMEEKRNILNQMAMHTEKDADLVHASESRSRAGDIEKHIEGLKFILSKLKQE